MEFLSFKKLKRGIDMGFFGMGNDSKNVVVVRKDAPEKKAFFQFIDMVLLRFGKMISQSLIYLFYCLPGVIVGCVGYYFAGILIPTNDALFEIVSSVVIAVGYGLTGPANVAITKISRYYMEGKMVMLIVDFKDAFKQNFKQGLARGMFQAISLLLFYHSTIFYVEKFNEEGSTIYLIALCLVLCVSIVLLFASYYSGLLAVSVDLPFMTIMKNSIIFSSLGIKNNIIITICAGVIMVPVLLFFPLTILTLLIVPAVVSLIIVFNTYQYIYKYAIKPYYDENGLENPYEKQEEDISIFAD